MPCICGKCDDKKKAVIQLALGARDVARLMEKPQQLMFTNSGVLVTNATDEWPTNMTRVAVLAPDMTDEDVAWAVEEYYAVDRLSFLEQLLVILTDPDSDVDDVSAN